MTPSEWAARRGYWNPDHMPWLGAIIDAAADPRIEIVVVTGVPQSGKTTALNAIARWTVEHDADPALIVTSTEEAARALSKRLGEDSLLRFSGCRRHLWRSHRAILLDDLNRYPRDDHEIIVHLARERTRTYRNSAVVVAGGYCKTIADLYEQSDQREYVDGAWRSAVETGFVAGFKLDLHP